MACGPLPAALTFPHTLSAGLTHVVNRESSWQARATRSSPGITSFSRWRCARLKRTQAFHDEGASPDPVVVRAQERDPLYGACGNPACKAGRHIVALCASAACPLVSGGVHHAVDISCAACLEHPKPGTNNWRPMQRNVQEFLGIPTALASQLQVRVST